MLGAQTGSKKVRGCQSWGRGMSESLWTVCTYALLSFTHVQGHMEENGDPIPSSC